MKAALVGALLFLSLSVAAGASAMAVTASRHSRHSTARDVVGIVMRGPTTPICSPRTPCAGPAAGVTVKALEAGRLVATTTTNRRGRFGFSLAPGYYTIAAYGRGAEPRTVRVTAAARVHLTFLIDTGIR